MRVGGGGSPLQLAISLITTWELGLYRPDIRLQASPRTHPCDHGLVERKDDGSGGMSGGLLGPAPGREAPILYLIWEGRGPSQSPSTACVPGLRPTRPPAFLLSPKGGFLQSRVRAASRCEQCYGF